ncbi:hypothetical protein GWI33_013315 [Rhynchophorus ferrugineus]|uniref:VacJ family lipoprotein n=1 Tax=Rhynchophorus ferrugineus TaxID=354439 RepID=A0A834I4V2_RHYFE|nr:hypothetical protein GWI33_013315 [Rhynchophorus ferrugineus]
MSALLNLPMAAFANEATEVVIDDAMTPPITASTQKGANQPESIKDPLEPLNRKIYNFNTSLDKAVVRPLAVQYQEKVPEDVRGSYSNFRSNLREPWNAINQLLQGDPKTALRSLGRFTINTVTSLGMADAAKHLKLNAQKEDLGTTMGYWGVKSGPYIVLPIFGPSTFRDGVGLVFDIAAQPQGYTIDNDKVYWTNSVVSGVASRADFLAVDSIVQGDQYAVLRDVYLQQRAFTIANKRGEDASEGMFMDDPFQDEELYDEDIPDTAPAQE